MNFVNVEAHYTPQVALESIGNIADKSFGSMVNAIKNFFPSIVASFSGVVESVSKLKPLPADLINGLSEMYARNEVKQLDFTTFGKVTCRVPEGFSGNLEKYSEFLARSWDFLQTDAIPQMDILYGQLASFVSNKSAKISLANTATIFGDIQAKHDNLAKESQIYFGKDRHNSIKSDLGTAYGEYGYALHTEARIAQLAKSLSHKQVEQVLGKINRISSVIDIIIKDAQASEYDKASYEAVKGMATGIYAMAQAMEFYSLTYYRINEMAVVCKENKEVIRKLK
jgi:hypothetical protein